MPDCNVRAQGDLARRPCPPFHAGYEFGADIPHLPVTADAKKDFGAKGDNETDDTEVGGPSG